MDFGSRFSELRLHNFEFCVNSLKILLILELQIELDKAEYRLMSHSFIGKFGAFGGGIHPPFSGRRHAPTHHHRRSSHGDYDWFCGLPVACDVRA